MYFLELVKKKGLLISLLKVPRYTPAFGSGVKINKFEILAISLAQKGLHVLANVVQTNEQVFYTSSSKCIFQSETTLDLPGTETNHISYRTRRYSGGLKYSLLRMKVKGKEKL